MKSRTLRVLAFTGFYLPGYKGGGPIKTTKNLLDNSGSDVLFNLITSDRDLCDPLPYETVRCGAWNQVGSASVFYVQPGFLGYRQISRIIQKQDHDVIYLNSFFSIRFSLFPLLISKLLGRRIVLGPRGEFSEGALSLKSKKKKLFIWLYKLLKLHDKTVFQASSTFEAEDIRRTLGDQVDIQIAEDIGSQEFASRIKSKKTDALHIVFVSRISPMKNLKGAIEMLAKANKPIAYDIYGPIEDQQYWENCQIQIKTLPAHIKVNYKGSLSPQDVVTTMANYDAFYMPTKGENYGHVIAEALCAGLPLVIADTTPWRELENKGLGWDLPLTSPDAFSSALDELASMPAESHLKMREDILVWAKEKFSQRDAIEANIAMFRHAHGKYK